MKKKTARKLKAIAEQVGDIQKQIMTEEPIMGWELLLSGYGKDRNYAKTIKPDQQYFLNVPTIIKQSTEKELKRNYRHGGVQEVAQTVRAELHKRKTPQSQRNNNE
jgi:hypothetical protein